MSTYTSKRLKEILEKRKKKIYICENKTCMTITCSKNYKQHPSKVLNQGTNMMRTIFEQHGPKDCDMYVGVQKFSTVFKKEDYEDLEDFY